MNEMDWAGLADFNFKTTAQLLELRRERDGLKKQLDSKQQLIEQQTKDITRLKAEIEQLKQQKANK